MYGPFHEDHEDFLRDGNNYVNVWVDGCCFHNGQPGAYAGYGVFYNYGHYLNTSEPVKGRATNNAGEIQSAICAIWQCMKERFSGIQINSDSKFLIDSVQQHLQRWEQNGFRKVNGEPLANQRDFMNLSKALNQAKNRMHVVFNYVPAHSGDEYNDEADRLAKEGANRYGQN